MSAPTIRPSKQVRDARAKTVERRRARRAERKVALHTRLFALRGATKQRLIATYDIESKSLESDRAGWSRAFLVGFYDGSLFRAFRNRSKDEAPRLYEAPVERRHIEPGGCVDQFLRAIVGRVRNGTVVGARHDLTKDKAVLCAHNGGHFDVGFLIPWFREHSNEFVMRATYVSTRVLLLEVSRRESGAVSSSKRKHRKRDAWVFVDTFPLLLGSLKKVAKVFAPLGAATAASSEQAAHTRKIEWDLNLPETACYHCGRAKVTHDRGKAPEECPGYVDGWQTYLEADCRALANAVEGFRTLLERLGGELGVTAPDSAMRLFRRSYLGVPIERHQHWRTCPDVSTCGHDEGGGAGRAAPCLHEFILRAYVGGRCEIYGMTAGRRLRIYDLNSSYPHVMREYAMPVGRKFEVDGSMWPTWSRTLRRQGFVGFVHADIWIPPSCRIPPIPVKRGGKLTFPVGYLSDVYLSDVELQLLDDPYVQGRVLRVHRSVWYEGRVVFREFVDSLYSHRVAYKTAVEQHEHAVEQYGKDSDEARALADEVAALEPLDTLAKTMLASAYGKFGQNAAREDIVFTGAGTEMPNGQPLYAHDDPATADVWRVPTWRDSPYIIPQVAAQITSLARRKLWLAQREADAHGGRLTYSDTDSIHVEPPPHLSDEDADAWFLAFEARIGISQTELGKWKREKHSTCGAEYIALKSYLLLQSDGPPIPRLKGVPRTDAVTGESLHTEENFRRLQRGETIYYASLRKPRTLTQRGDAAPTVLERASKSVRSTYTKRVVLKSGDTRPLELDERGDIVPYVSDADRASRPAPSTSFDSPRSRARRSGRAA